MKGSLFDKKQRRPTAETLCINISPEKQDRETVSETPTGRSMFDTSGSMIVLVSVALCVVMRQKIV
eukprot:3464905-Amphidinium_carterae.2